jgi:hypothetical protein
MALYAQTSGEQSTSSASWKPIPGLSFTLPEGVGTCAGHPEPAESLRDRQQQPRRGSRHLGERHRFGRVASFTYNKQVPPSTGRIPTTPVVGVPLTAKPQTIAAPWQGVRGSTVIIDSSATLSAILG